MPPGLFTKLQEQRRQLEDLLVFEAGELVKAQAAFEQGEEDAARAAYEEQMGILSRMFNAHRHLSAAIDALDYHPDFDTDGP